MPKRRNWGDWATIHADVPKNGAFCGGCIYCDHEDGACTITSASIWDIGKGGWRKCKHYTLYSIADTFKRKLEEFDFNGASEYLKEHSAYITEKDYTQMREVLYEFNPKSHRNAVIENSTIARPYNMPKVDVKNVSGSTPDGELSAREFRAASFDAYMVYIDWANGKVDDGEALSKIAPLCAIYGLTVDEYTLTLVFGFALYAFGRAEGEVPKYGVTRKQHHIKSIATFRKFIKGGWKEYVGYKDIQIGSSIKIISERRDC